MLTASPALLAVPGCSEPSILQQAGGIRKSRQGKPLESPLGTAQDPTLCSDQQLALLDLLWEMEERETALRSTCSLHWWVPKTGMVFSPSPRLFLY